MQCKYNFEFLFKPSKTPLVYLEILFFKLLPFSFVEQEAYKKYVGCTYRIATNLILAIRSAGKLMIFIKCNSNFCNSTLLVITIYNVDLDCCLGYMFLSLSST